MENWLNWEAEEVKMGNMATFGNQNDTNDQEHKQTQQERKTFSHDAPRRSDRDKGTCWPPTPGHRDGAKGGGQKEIAQEQKKGRARGSAKSNREV